MGYQHLFQHMEQEHGLVLLESELHEIALKVTADHYSMLASEILGRVFDDCAPKPDGATVGLHHSVVEILTKNGGR